MLKRLLSLHYSGSQGCWDSLKAKLTLLDPVVKAEFPSRTKMANQAHAEKMSFNELNPNPCWAFVYHTWRNPETKNWIETRLLSRKINSEVILLIFSNSCMDIHMLYHRMVGFVKVFYCNPPMGTGIILRYKKLMWKWLRSLFFDLEAEFLSKFFVSGFLHDS